MKIRGFWFSSYTPMISKVLFSNAAPLSSTLQWYVCPHNTAATESPLSSSQTSRCLFSTSGPLHFSTHPAGSFFLPQYGSLFSFRCYPQSSLEEDFCDTALSSLLPLSQPHPIMFYHTIMFTSFMVVIIFI